jgi:acetolactate synthase-1/2/3 large subunit
MNSRPLSQVDSRANKVRAADLVLQILADAGIDTVFGLPGGTIAPIFDAFIDNKDMKLIVSAHENTAVFAACGYAALTGKPGVVLVTSGPGILNAMTGIASAFNDGIPLIVLVGEVATTNLGRKALQEGSQHGLDILSMLSPITKMAEMIGQPRMIAPLLTRALSIASSGCKGPVLLQLPIDVLRAGADPVYLSAAPRVEFGLDLVAVREVAQILENSRRPLIFAGAGCRSTHATAALVRLAEKLQCPVVTTPKGKGVFPESHPLALGVIGTGGHPSAHSYLQGGIDDLLAVGTSLGELATDGWSALLEASNSFMQIDIETRNIGRNYRVSHALIGHAGTVLDQVNHAIIERPRAMREFGVRTDPANELPESQTITAPVILRTLQDLLPEKTTYCADIGEHLLFATHFLAIDNHEHFFVMSGLGSMGSGFGAAFGVASQGKRTVAICGDGGFMMMLGDVATAVRERLPIVFCVINDRRYGMVELGNQAVYGRTQPYPQGTDQLAQVTRQLGARSFTVSTLADLAMLPGELEATTTEPLVIDVRVDLASRMKRNKRFESLCGVEERR